MSTERSSTIGRERATNHALAFRDVQEFVLRRPPRVSTPRPPTTERRRLAQPRPVGRAARRSRRARAAAATRPCSTFARSPTTPPGTCRARSASRSTARSFGTKAGFVLDRGRADRAARALARARRIEAARGLWAVGMLDLAGYVARRRMRPRRSQPWTSRELKRLLETADVQLVDVRETSRARRRLHPGLAQHPVPADPQARLRRTRRDRPVVHGLRERPARARSRPRCCSARGSTCVRGRRRRDRRLRRRTPSRSAAAAA